MFAWLGWSRILSKEYTRNEDSTESWIYLSPPEDAEPAPAKRCPNDAVSAPNNAAGSA